MTDSGERDGGRDAEVLEFLRERAPDAWIPAVQWLVAELGRVRAERDAARALLEQIAAHHDGCEDGFYACPKHPDYFGQYVDNNVPIEQRPCYCWADKARAVLASRGARGGRRRRSSGPTVPREGGTDGR